MHHSLIARCRHRFDASVAKDKMLAYKKCALSVSSCPVCYLSSCYTNKSHQARSSHFIRMPETDSKSIFTGFWTDESTPGVLGSTWTMEQQYANFVVALIAILVSVGVNSAWSLLLFIVHQSRATAVPKDGLFRQQQVLLRSLGSPGSISLDSLKIAQAWSGFSSSAYLRCLVLTIVGLVFATGGLVAGVVSSGIVSLTDLRVLVKSSSCQQLNMTEYFSAESISTVGLDTEVHNVAIAYADQCYGTWKAPSQCNSYVIPRISFNSSFGRSPFGMLVEGNTDRALTLDSGYLDSNDVFGINARPRDRVEIRRKATCSPLESVSYTSIIDPGLDPRPFRTNIGRDPIPGERLYATHYGVGKFGLDAVYNATDVRSSLLSNITSRYHPTSVSEYASPLHCALELIRNQSGTGIQLRRPKPVQL